ncbi:ATP-dependent carboxylate-amine ligase [Candidatus Uhrbacteria bacterium]|nr:ATP-dependent carboxylate-amine ligase [Candidatus Uhrbacteria bacterium]
MRARDTVLIVTNRYDEHASRVIKVFNERDIPVFRLNTEDLPREIMVEWRGEQWELRYHGRTLTPDCIRSCWYRRPSDAVVHDEIVDAGVQTFVRDECHYVLQGLYRCLSDIVWVSHPDALHAAQYKLHQLMLARELGFQTPETLVTNNPETFRGFWSAHQGRVIVKIAGRGPATIPLDTAIFTSVVGEDALSHADTIRFAPHLFQQYVDKQYEARVTIIGDKVFAVRIDSQESEKTRIDWRHYDFEHTLHSAITLPSEVEARCREMVRRYGLNFGAIDLIFTPDGEWVFLEINPNGQWLWLEELTKLPMTDALVELLAWKQGGAT